MEDNRTPLVIIGTDVAARIALDITLSLDMLVYGFLSEEEEKVNQEISDVLVVAALGSKDADILLRDEHIKRVLGFRDGDKRRTMLLELDELPGDYINLFHPSTILSPTVRFGRGNLIHAGSVLQTQVLLGSFNMLGTHVSIGPDTIIGDYCTIQDGVRIGREVEIEDEVFIGIGAIINPGVALGEGCMVGPGAVVLHDVEPGNSVFGNPARTGRED